MVTALFGEVPRMGRKSRKPLHPFNLKTQPMSIVPMLIAPVLPGDTMENLLLQSRVVTKPILNPLIGWWKEYYFFYVKLSQLDGGEDFKEMHVDLEHSLAAYIPAATNAKYYTYDDNGGVNFVEQCLKLVTEEFFRDEGEAWDNVTIDGYPAAALNRNSWMDSLNDATLITDGGDLGDIQTAAEDVTMDELDRAFRTWQHLAAHQLTNASYEDYLKSHGIRGNLVADPDKPELIRYVRDWTYPSNTIDPADGSPVSAVSWAITERADKNRFCPEPGFIFGVTITRPKLYMAKQKATMSQWLDTALMWLPAIMRDDPYSSLREFSNAQGPLGGNATNGYWVDMADLFRYGDQFVNYDIDADATGVGVDLPTAALNKSYPTEAMIDTIFVGADATNGVTEDGIVSLNIQSAIVQEIT